jgi:hypothetical protein
VLLDEELLAPIEALASTENTVCAVAGREASCWTIDSDSNDVTATDVELPSRVFSLVGGRDHFCGVFELGRVACWGDNSYRQLVVDGPASRDRPTMVRGISSAVSLAAGSGFTCALLRRGDVSCWGDRRLAERAASNRLSDIVAIAAHDNGACALRRYGRLLCWSGSTGPTEVAHLEERPMGAVALALAAQEGEVHRACIRAQSSVSCFSEGEWDTTAIVDRTYRQTPAER